MNNTWKKTFAIIWTGQFLSMITSSAVNFAIIIWLSLETGSAEVLAYAAIAGLLPQAIIGPFAGVYIDRWDRKLTMIIADAFIALCTLGMSLLFFFGYYEMVYIYVILGLRSVGSAFHSPAMQASVPLLAPSSELLRIAGINQTIASVSNIAGPALGALAIGLMNIGEVLLLDIAGAIIAIISLTFVKIPNPPRDSQEKASVNQVLRDLSIGIKAVTQNKGLSYMFLFAILVTFSIMPLAVLFPLLTLEHFKGGKFEMSVIEIAWGVGMLAGGGLLGIFKPTINKIVILNSMNLLLGITLAYSGLLSSHAFIFFTILTAVGGLAASIFNATFVTVIQENIDPSMLGRVFSMYFSIALLPSLIGLLGTGFLADYIGLNLTFVILGSAVAVIGLISFFVVPLMKLGNIKPVTSDQGSSATSHQSSSATLRQ